MSFRVPLRSRPRAPSTSSSSSSDGSDAPGAPFPPPRRDSRRCPPPDTQAMDRRHGRVFSHSSPELVHRPDPASSTLDARGSAALHPPRTHAHAHSHSHGAVASHFLAQPADAYGGQTWMDFLRESGADPHVHGPGAQQAAAPPQPSDLHAPPSSSRLSLAPRQPSSESSSRSSSDRKRRLTTAESPLRRPSGLRMPSGAQVDPAALDSSPPAPLSIAPPPAFLPQAQAAAGGIRRESDIVLPLWQPDADVTHCPVCGSQFTFFYRKHHCRKCGRVVCSACSPHRITIPRQFIVHPPSENPNIIDLTAEDDDNTMSAFGPFRNPALGGGEEVRVCNPCVPDPNYSPPPQYTRYPSQLPSPMPRLPPGPGPLHRMHSRGHRSSQSVNDGGAQTVGPALTTPRPRDPFSDRRVSFHDRTRVSDLWPPTQAPQPGHAHAHLSQYDGRARAHSRPQPTSTSTPAHLQSDTGNYSGSTMFRRPFFPHGQPVRPGSPLPPPPQPQPTPRRQIAEEDECPICGNELPPKGPDGDDSARTQHVEECIVTHSSSPPPPSANDQTSTSLPSQRTRGMSNAALATGNGEGASTSNRLSLSARGMFYYTATEKDCVDEEGKEAECVICFEEFEAGDKMARLVCWCKFHETCIKQWWDKKGRGACPTHQLQF